jgi:hypothetical protein
LGLQKYSSGLDFSFERVHGSPLYENPLDSDAASKPEYRARRASGPGRNPRMNSTPPPDQSDSEPPGVPGFRTWRGVYWFVFGAFVAMVIALAIFTRVYA